MARHPLGILIIALVPAILAVAVLGAAEEPAFHWQINANGAEGTLDLSTESGGRISGTLLGIPVEGRLVGRHLILFRDGAGGLETWEASLATPENVNGDNQPILAGTFLRPGEDGPLPWFGTSRSVVAESGIPLAAPLVPLASLQTSKETASGSQTVVPPPTTVKAQDQQPVQQDIPSLASPAPAPFLPSGKPSLAGTWHTPDGPLAIRQEGSSLTFILPDREISGRLTGADSLIGGFGPGCCKGHLEQGFAVIVWDNGTRWLRR